MHYKNAEIHSWISGHEIKYIDTNNLVSNYSLEFIFAVVGNFIFHSHYSLLGLDRSHLSAYGKESDKHWKKIQSHNRWSHIFHALSAHIKRNITESVNYSCRYGINSRKKGMHNCSWQTRKRNPEIFYLNVNSNSVAQRETKIYVMWVMGFADNIRYDGFGNVRK